MYDEPRRDEYRRPRVSYDDIDRPVSRASDISYDDRERDRDHYREQDRDRHSKRPRNRTRSPNPQRRAERGSRADRFVREGHYDRRDEPIRRPRDGNQDSRNGGSMPKRATVGEASRTLEDDAKPGKGTANGDGFSRPSER